MTSVIRDDVPTRRGGPRLGRRDLLKAGGAVVVSAAAPPLAVLGGRAASAADAIPGLAPDQLDSWLAVHEDGHVTAFFGKMDMGHGLGTAIGQIVAEELDVPFERVQVVMGDTGLTCDQGGGSGSTGIQWGGVTMRNAAAEARRVLLGLAAERLEAPVEQLTVADGVVTIRNDPRQFGTAVGYGELIGGRRFDVRMEWNGNYGNQLVSKGRAEPKDPADYKVVGRSLPDVDVPDKVLGRRQYVTDVKVEGMLHARVIRPPVAGAEPVAVDEGSIAELPGARVLRKGALVAVLAPDEWDAIKAAERLRVTWSEAAAPFPEMAAIYDHIREAPVVEHSSGTDDGDVEAAFAAAGRVLEAEYEWPFQSHASMGPGCALADVRGDAATIWTGSQKPYDVRYGAARILDLPLENVRAIWLSGPGSYGRNDAGDVAMEAAVLSQLAGAPVRLQYMRDQGTAWDPKGPASVIRMRGALEDGEVVAHAFDAKGFSRVNMAPREAQPGDTLVGMLLGHAPGDGHNFNFPAESYRFANKRAVWETIPPLLARASPLRTAHFRDPNGPEVHFASESFIDELAAEAGADPVEFRLRYVTDPRDVAVIRAAAEAAGWDARPSPTGGARGGDLLTGRGFAYAQRNAATVACVAEIEVERATGRIFPRRFVVGHECGLVVNPEGLRLCVEGNVMQATSRMLFEEVQFDRESVTSVDWLSYPILETPEVPAEIVTVLIDRPDLLPRGAGEPSTRVVAPAIANAFFDATGVRLRRAPFTRERVLAALA